MPSTCPSDVFNALLPAARTMREPRSAAPRIRDGATERVNGSKRSLAVWNRLHRTRMDYVDAEENEPEVSEDHVWETRDSTTTGLTPFPSLGASKPEGAEWMKIGSGDTRIIILDGVEYVVSGPYATLLANELLRSHRGPQQRLRRKRVLYAVTINFAVVGLSSWTIVENVIAVIRKKDLGLGKAVEVVRWIELGVGIGSLAVGIGVFGWLRTRRAHFSTYLVLPFATFSILSHLLLAFTNLVLTQKHRFSLSNRCKWGISMTWSSGPSTRICPPSDEMAKAWLSAALLRIIVTIFIAGLWFAALWEFQRSLRKRVLPLMSGDGIHTKRGRAIADWRLSNEARALLAQSGASIRLSNKTDQLCTHRGRERLLHMPEYEPGRSEEEFDDEDEEDEAVNLRSQTESSLGIWLGAKLFGWMSWGMGLSSYNESKDEGINGGDGADDREEEKELVQNKDQPEPNCPGQHTA